MNTPDTMTQANEAVRACRNVYVNKLKDYGATWRIMRPASLTDQIFIKAKRIRTLETTGEAQVDEGILPEFTAIVNYGIMGLAQLERGAADTVDITPDEAVAIYDRHAGDTLRLMQAKNHDYGEAWRSMRVNSFTDFILTKINRVKQIEENDGITTVSEGVDSNYMDIINYAIFAIITLTEPDAGHHAQQR